MLRLPRKLRAPPCTSLPLEFTMCPPSIAKILRLPRSVYLTLRKCRTYHDINTSAAKVLRLSLKTDLGTRARVRANGPLSAPGTGPSRTGAAANLHLTSCTLPRFCAFSIFSRAQTRCIKTAPATKSALLIYFKSLPNHRLSFN